MKNTIIRKALEKDLEFMIQADLSPEGYSSENDNLNTSDASHTKKISAFITDKDKGSLIITSLESDEPLGCLMYRLINLNNPLPDYSVFHKMERNLFPADGRLIEIFQLWIRKDHRNLGFATALKIALEEKVKNLGINYIYTHTEEINEIVLKLNRNLNYKEIRRGPLWDNVIRVSLLKKLL